MIVAFRADASIEIGTGHVMRCLTLAHALRSGGANCRFIMRDLPGHLAKQVSDAGFDVSLLPAPDGPVPAGPPAHAGWAGVVWEKDSAETRALLDSDPPDWLIVDHYAFDARWQKAARPSKTKCMVIDDLADRPHDCDILLDQNFGHQKSLYDGLVPASCQCLMGPQYALLRPEFAALRAQSLARRKDGVLQRLLITMGGVDAADATSAVLKAMRGASLPQDLQVVVIMGAKAPALAQVRALANAMPWPCDVLVDVPDMAHHMAMADLAISAGGGTTWERCCLGLPSIIVETAENQAGVAKAMAKAGAALDPGPLRSPGFVEGCYKGLRDAADPAHLGAMSKRAAAICDGNGVRRVMTDIPVRHDV